MPFFALALWSHLFWPHNDATLAAQLRCTDIMRNVDEKQTTLLAQLMHNMDQTR